MINHREPNNHKRGWLWLASSRYYVQCNSKEEDAVLHDKPDFAVRRHVAPLDFGLLFALGQQ